LEEKNVRPPPWLDNVSGPGGGITVREEKGEDEGRLMLQSTEIFDFHLTILNIYDIVNRR